MKKILAFVLSFIMIAMLSACGNSAASVDTEKAAAVEEVADNAASTDNSADNVAPADDTASAEGGVTINFVMAEPNYTEALQHAISRWEEKTGNKVNIMMTEDPTTAVYTQIQAGGTLDLFRGDSTKLAETTWPAEYFYDLSNEEWVSRLTNPSLISFSDGSIKGVPISSASMLGVLYRKSIFEQAGITSDPATFDEFLADLELIKTKTDAVPLQVAAESDSSWSAFHVAHALFSGLYNSRGEAGAREVFDAFDKGELKFVDVPEYKQAIDSICQIRDGGYINEDFISSTFDSSIDRFGKGEAACFVCGDYVIEPLFATYPDIEDDLGFFSLPFGDTNGSMPLATYPGIHVAYNAPHLAEALDFLNYFCSKENQEIFNEECPGYNLFNDVPTSGNVISEYCAENVDRVFTEVDDAGVYYWAEIEGRRCLQELLQGTMTSEEMLQRMDEEATITCQSLGMEGF